MDMVKSFNNIVNETKNELEKIQQEVTVLEERKKRLEPMVKALNLQVAELSEKQEKLLAKVNEQVKVAVAAKQVELDKEFAVVDATKHLLNKKNKDNERKEKELSIALTETVNAKKNYEQALKQCETRQTLADTMIAKLKKVVDVIETTIRG